MKYRREIDGLRAIAVLPVILFHAHIAPFSGGFVGVDIFFVISGYLITSILIGDLERGEFSLARFYERRARRILPALFLVMACSFPLAWMWMLPWQLEEFGQSVLAVVFFVSNILFWHQDNYFAPDAELKPLLHTWSLAVEEQYYLLFPLLLLGLWRLGRTRVFWIVATLGAASLALSEWYCRSHHQATFFLAPTRAWELLVGSCCAFILSGRELRSSSTLSVAGLGMVLAAIFAYDNATPFPGLHALVPVGGTALILLFAREGTWVARALAARPLVGIGLISYSAYLWHQPIFAFARLRTVTRLSQNQMLSLALLALVLAYFSWRYVEKPFRIHAQALLPKLREVVCASAWAAAAVVLFGSLTVAFHGFTSRVDLAENAQHLGLGGYEADNERLRRRTWKPLREATGSASYGVEDNAADLSEWSSSKTGRINILLVGNSHSKDMFNALSRSVRHGEDFKLSRYGAQISRLLTDDRFLSSPNFARADLVVIVSRYDAADLEAMPKVLEQLSSKRKPVAIVLNTPEFSGDIALNMVDKVVWHETELAGLPSQAIGHRIDTLHFHDYAGNRELHERNAKMEGIARAHAVPVFSREDYMCEPGTERCRGISAEGAKLFYDYGHTTVAGADFFAKRIDALGWLERMLAIAEPRRG